MGRHRKFDRFKIDGQAKTVNLSYPVGTGINTTYTQDFVYHVSVMESIQCLKLNWFGCKLQKLYLGICLLVADFYRWP